MNKWKKAISVGMSAALLASLFTVIAASTALASITGTSAGNVAQGTTSVGTASYLFTESSATALTALAPGSMTVTINAASGITWAGTPVVSAPGSLGATATIAGNILTISITASDNANVETISVSGLKVAVPAGAPLGAVAVTLAGAIAPAFTGGTTTASGKLTTAVGVGSTGFTISLDTGSCAFNVAGASVANPLVIAGTNPETITVATIAALTLGQQAVSGVNGATGTTVNHLANDPITQTGVPGCVTISSPATVVAALGYASAGNLNVFPGETNSPAANLTLTEPVAGSLTTSTTVTFTINTAGVTFSTRPIANVTSGNLVLGSAIGAPANEVQSITLTNAGVGDTFTLTFAGQTTAALAADTATAAQVQTALENLSNIAVGDVVVTGAAGGPYTVTFGGVYAATNVAAITGVGTDGVDAGVVAPTVTVATITDGGSSVTSAVTLSADRKSASFTISTASTVASTILVSNILYDVAATVPGGTFVDVTVTAGSLLVNPTHRTNAVVGRGLNATATPTTVFIGQNGQKSGLTTITELSAGFFQGGTGSNNTIQVCLINNAETFTSPGPWAKVTAGDLRLREGSVSSPDNIVPGTAVFFAGTGDTCYTWTVWTASTTVSTIVIGNSDFTSGPIIDVPANSVPGAVTMSIFLGNGSVIPTSAAVAATVQIATAVFQNQVVVTALSQPVIPVGSNGSLAGDIQIQETATGQLKAGERICVEILPNQNAGTLYDAFLKGLNTADVPLATGSNGIVVGPVAIGAAGVNCAGSFAGTGATNLVISFSFVISQQSTSGTGKLVISNIKYATVNDAVTGPVQVSVYGFGGIPTSVQFQTLISNARIGTALAGSASSRLGVTRVGAFTTSTKVAARRHYVTFRFDFGVAAAGAHFQIWSATKTGNDWSAFHLVTSRVANASGVVYYYIRSNATTWKSFRAYWAGGGVWSPARQARWR